MQAVIFIGIQATGKSSFFKDMFFDSHIRINLDMLRTRHRERLLMNACIEAKQPFAIDNTNPSAKDRAGYIEAAKAAGFEIVGYYFQSNIGEAIARNSTRTGSDRVPPKGIAGTHKRLELPSLAEGFDILKYVMIKDGKFVVKDWLNEI